MSVLTELHRDIGLSRTFHSVGRIKSANGVLTADIPAAIHEQCQVIDRNLSVMAEVIGFNDDAVQIMPYYDLEGLSRDARVIRLEKRSMVPYGPGLLGRVIDAFGNPMDGKGPLRNCRWNLLEQNIPCPLSRTSINVPFPTGQRTIDGLLTIGRGQRMGLFAGSGVGKSTLLGEIAKSVETDINVIALIGERGREVRPFLDECLGEKGMERSVVIVATSDQSSLVRVRAAETAVSIASQFRSLGQHVLLMLDSITRLAHAQREIGLVRNEPPTARGYTPSVLRLITKILEAMGNGDVGSITGIVTVLVDGDDFNEPISDAVRSIVDGHTVLTREMAQRGHYPAIDVLHSISRVARNVISDEHAASAQKIRDMLAIQREMEDLIRVGAYVKGSSEKVDKALELADAIDALRFQRPGESTPFAQTVNAMKQIAAAWKW
ncbi:MAG: FliI/YscN family ATPase [Pirellulaceae bacterium]